MSGVFEQLLRVRHFDEAFLSPKYEDCLDPFLLSDMEEAVARIKLAVERGEKVLIYGDYDVDGVTASTVMYDTLRLAGVKEVEIMLPNRFIDGYGMSHRVVERVKEWEAGLVVTVDCGSRNHEVIGELGGMGVEVVVTDHHECGWDSLASQDDSSESMLDWARTGSKPEAVAIVNPKREDMKCPAALRDLAGVGVAFKLAQALVQRKMIPAGQEKWLLDLVLIGTVCDSMVLLGENRRLCYYGMKVLEKTRRPGLKELLKMAGVRKLDTEAIGFQIGPRLNAAGRMETADLALELLMTDKRTQAAKIVGNLEELNNQRKSQQRAAILEIEERGVGDLPVIVAEGKWHEGVLGIIAGRLVEEYKRPAFVVSEVEGKLKGSGRSFGEFNLAEALTVCGEYIIGGGGHAAACGLALEIGGTERFRQAVNEYYKSLDLKDQERFLGVEEDLVVEEFEELSLELMAEMRKLEPYGEGNLEPVFLLPEVRVIEAAKLGADGRHLRLTVWDRLGRSMKLMCFYAPEEYLRLQGGETINAWITLGENEFRGIRSVEGRIVKIA